MNEIENCYQMLLQHITKSLEDENCFYYYQIADKQVNSDGKTSNYIKEQVCKLFNIKAAKDTLEILQKLGEKQDTENKDSTNNVILIPEVK